MSEMKTELSNFGEMFDRSTKLAGMIKAKNVLGEKTGEEAIKANDVAQREILKGIVVGFGYGSVEQMKEITLNENVPEGSRLKAKEALKDLSTAVLIAEPRMYDWVQSGNVDNHVPECFRGISSEIGHNLLVRDENDEVGKFIVSKLKEVEGFNEKVKLMPSIFGKKKSEFMEGVGTAFFEKYDELRGKGLDNSEDGLKLQQIMIYVEKSVAENNVEQKVPERVETPVKPQAEIVTNSYQEQYYKDLAEYQKKEGVLKEKITQLSIEELIKAFVGISTPRERAPQIWEYEAPKWIGNVGLERGKGKDVPANETVEAFEKRKVNEWRTVLKFSEGWFANVYNKRNDSDYNNNVEKMGGNILSKTGLEEQDFDWFCKQRALKGREVISTIMKDLMEPKVIEATVEGRRQSTTIYVLKQGVDGNYDGEAKKYQENETDYKNRLAKKLVTERMFESEELAKLSIATAMNLMEMGGTFSLADTKRFLSWESDALRLVQRPETKFGAKVGKELWGGPWGEYAMTMSDGNRNVAENKLNEYGVIPKLLAGSFMNQEVDVGKIKVSMADALYNGDEIKFRETDKDLFFGWRKDQVKAGTDMYLYLSGKNLLEFRKFEELDNAISKWRGDLYNAVKTLRGNGASLVTWEMVAGAVGGSVGLWPFEGPYLRLPLSGEGSDFQQYTATTSEIMRSLAFVSDNERNKISDFFGNNRSNRLDFPDRVADYTYMIGGRVSEQGKEKLSRRLKRKRGQY